MEVLRRDYSPSNWAVKRDLTVVTNSLGIPAALSRHAVRDIVVLGGEYRAESHITVGSVTFCGAIPVSADSAVLGVGGNHTGRYFCRVATGCNDDGKHDRRCSQNHRPGRLR